MATSIKYLCIIIDCLEDKTEFIDISLPFKCMDC